MALQVAKRQGASGKTKSARVGKMPLYNGSVRRPNAKGNRNSVCVTYSSPKLKELVKQLPARTPTLYGQGSVAHTEATPSAYSLPNCNATAIHSPVANRNVLLQDKPFTPTYSPVLGETLFWCQGCRQWIVTARQFVPKPREQSPWVKPYWGTNGLNGNAMVEPGKHI